MLHDLGLATRYASLASAGITHLSLDRSGAVVSGNSSSHNLLLIAGVVGMLVILGGVVAVVFVRHKRAGAWDESGYQSEAAVVHNRPGYAGYGQNYSRGTIAGQQDPWPWARKPSPPGGYNPVTPVPEMLRTSSDPITPVPEIAAVPALPMQYAVQQSPLQRPPMQQPPVRQPLMQQLPIQPPVRQPLMQQLPIQPPVQQPPAEQSPVMVSDPALKAIMRQAQVGLFALPAQNKGQKDREAAL
jgi:hypothetical protein